jgi:hypothetical protein
MSRSFPRRFRFCGDSQLAREDIDRAERQNTDAREFETLRHIAQPVQYFVYRAITAGRDDGLKSFSHCGGSEFPRVTCGDSLFE